MRRYARLAKYKVRRGFLTGSNFPKFHLLKLYRNVAFTIENSAELIAPKGVHGDITPSSQAQLEGIQLVLRRQRLDGARFLAQKLVRSFLRTVNIHNAVNTLFEGTHAAVTDIRPVVVVAEENGHP